MSWTYATHFVCDDCGRSCDLRVAVNTCPHCGGLLEVQYDLAKLAALCKPEDFTHRPRSIWRWHELLPAWSERDIVTLGEGDTPLVPSVYAGPKLGLRHLYFKNDTLMPTGSFKDRGFSVAVSVAKSLRVQNGLTYTSGNAGSSFAAYASRAGLSATVLVEYLANSLKQALIRLYGSRTVILHFDSLSDITDMLQEAVQKLGVYQFVNFLNPVRHDAMKTYAYEISEALGWQSPDVMIHPVGTGGGLWGAWKGFRELQTLGWTNALPRMAAVQPAATGPIVQAFRNGERFAPRHGDPTKTIAQSIAGDAPIAGGTRVLNAVFDSGGWADTVTDEEILEAMTWLGREGIAAEPAACATLAALRRAVRDGRVEKGDRVVCVLTGSALRSPSAVQTAVGQPDEHIHASFTELAALLSQHTTADARSDGHKEGDE